jgi:hypothetical protein
MTRIVNFRNISFCIVLGLSAPIAFAQSTPKGIPSLPKSGGLGLQGSVGAGFGDFFVDSPSTDLKIDRGTYLVAGIERGFDFMHLYLTLGLSYMSANGVANYRYTDLSSSVTYTASDVTFRSNVSELTLGLKLKLIDDYWFRPYVEGGGIADYHQITYTSKQDVLKAQGSTYKASDVAMGSGTYAEAGIEAMFSDKFGVRLSARRTHVKTKAMETLNNENIHLTMETYYFALLFGF